MRDLATELGDQWAASPTPPLLRAELRIETRNTIYELAGGACVAVRRRDVGAANEPSAIVGMRLLGFLLPDDPYAGLQLTWRPGAFAVLWRPRRAGEATAQVALTSATTAVATAPSPRIPPPPPLPRIATPPSAARALLTPSGMRPIRTPPPLPARASMTRVHAPPPPIPRRATSTDSSARR